MFDMFNIASGWLQIVTIIILGVFSFLTLYERRKKQGYADTITNFKDTIESMKERMAEMDTELKQAKENHQESLQKIARLSGENETLRALLLGKDPKTVEYQNKSIELLTMLVNELKNHDAFVKKAHPEVVVD